MFLFMLLTLEQFVTQKWVAYPPGMSTGVFKVEQPYMNGAQSITL
jgi:hypothetical protein